jgi:hypothetical protein
MLIHRDFARTKEDDFTLNVAPRLHAQNEALEIWSENRLVAWKIKPRHE